LPSDGNAKIFNTLNSTLLHFAAENPSMREIVKRRVKIMEANPEQFLEGVCAPTLSLVFVIRPTKLLDAQICGVTGSNKNGWG